ncbi:MAG: hypothetical protein Q8880_06345 [Bacteroidota bacterium]|nr:hypothetical protein [Bacteroidota bacterium]
MPVNRHFRAFYINVVYYTKQEPDGTSIPTGFFEPSHYRSSAKNGKVIYIIALDNYFVKGRWNMSENEYMSIKEAICEVREGQRELLQAFNDMKLDNSEKYATKKELKEIADEVEKLKEEPRKRWDIVITTLITAIVTGAVAFFIK